MGFNCLEEAFVVKVLLIYSQGWFVNDILTMFMDKYKDDFTVTRCCDDTYHIQSNDGIGIFNLTCVRDTESIKKLKDERFDKIIYEKDVFGNK